MFIYMLCLLVLVPESVGTECVVLLLVQFEKAELYLGWKNFIAKTIVSGLPNDGLLIKSVELYKFIDIWPF